MAAKVRALLVCLSCLFIVSMLFSEAEAGRKHGKKSSSRRKADPFSQEETAISYDPIRIGDGVPCNGKNRDNCHKDEQANPYQRPCSKGNYCDRDP
ncbi:hypothetical protein AAC387_Pa07g0956 [Persea americana]